MLLVSLNVLVVVVGVVVGGVRCSWTQANTFSCYSWPPSYTECQLLHNGGMKTISRTCAIIQIKCVLPKLSQIAKFMVPTWGPPGSCRPQLGPMLAPWTLLSGVSPASVFVRTPEPHHPGTRLHLVPGLKDLGSLLILEQVKQYGNPNLICITEYPIQISIYHRQPFKLYRITHC